MTIKCYKYYYILYCLCKDIVILYQGFQVPCIISQTISILHEQSLKRVKVKMNSKFKSKQLKCKLGIRVS